MTGLAGTTVQAALSGVASSFNRKLAVRYIRAQLIKLNIITEEMAQTRIVSVGIEAITPMLLLGVAKVTPEGGNLEAIRAMLKKHSGTVLARMGEREVVDFVEKIIPPLLENFAMFALGSSHDKLKALSEGEDDSGLQVEPA